MNGTDGKKIFGRFNIVDVVVAVVIIGILAVAAWKFLGKPDASQSAVTITYTVRVTGVDEEMFDQIQKHVPSQLVSDGNLVEGNVISASAEENTRRELRLDLKNGVVYAEDGADKVDVLFTITASVQPGNLKTEVGSQEVRVGRTHIVKTTYFEVEGKILSVEGRP